MVWAYGLIPSLAHPGSCRFLALRGVEPGRTIFYYGFSREQDLPPQQPPLLNRSTPYAFLWVNKGKVLCGDWWIPGATSVPANILQDNQTTLIFPVNSLIRNSLIRHNTCSAQNFQTIPNRKATILFYQQPYCRYNWISEKDYVHLVARKESLEGADGLAFNAQVIRPYINSWTRSVTHK